MRLLDSDHCVAALRGTLNISKFVQPNEVLAVSSITVAELMHGAYRSQRRDENLAKINFFLNVFQILNFEYQSASIFGRLKAELEAGGQKIADLDLQIASIALVNQCLLVTHNSRHFQRVPNLELEDWLN